MGEHFLLLGKLQRITGNENAIHRLMRAFHGIPIVDVSGSFGIQLDGLPVIEAYRQRVVLADPLHGGKIPGTDTRTLIGLGELNPLSDDEIALLLAEDSALSGQLFGERRVVRDFIAVEGLHREGVGAGIDRSDGGCTVVRDAMLGGAPGPVVNLIARRIVCGEAGIVEVLFDQNGNALPDLLYRLVC